MATPVLSISGLGVLVAGKQVLSEIDLLVGPKQVVALMGANGSGKSSLTQTLLGSPDYAVEAGAVLFGEKDLLAMSIDERARQGMFVAWQNPVTVPGVSILSFLRVMHEANGGKITTLVKFRDEIRELLTQVGLPSEILERGLNEGFSGGEKKRFELLQLLLLKPKLAVLDEIDSGLDVDGLKMVAQIVAQMRESGTAFILITHYKKLLEYVKADRVVVLSKGKVVARGGSELVDEIEKVGYAKFT